MRQWIGSALVQIMACRLFNAKPLSKLVLGYCQLKYKTFHSRKWIWKCRPPKWQPFCPGGDELMCKSSRQQKMACQKSEPLLTHDPSHNYKPISQYRFRWWLGAEQVTSHNLDQWWPIPRTRIYITRPQCINSLWPSDTIWWHGTWSTMALLSQTITGTNTNQLLIGAFRTNNEINFKPYMVFSFNKMHFKMLSALWWPFC